VKKTEVRRRAIMTAAAEVFQESGFERSSMADICARVGYSKATLYSYFASKDELFFEVMTEATEAEFQTTLAALDGPAGDIAQALERFGERLLTFIYSPQVRAVRRLVVSEAGRSGLGRRCYELGPVRSDTVMAQFLQNAMESGKLRQADPHLAALHLKALLEAEWIDRFMFQTLEELAPEQAATTAARAVAVFMAAYGPTSASR
jgi:AcrR family transcriptional regulator